MRIEAGGVEADEAAAILAALEALLSHRGEHEPAAAPLSGWRLAARAFDDGFDAERALRRAKRRTS